MDIPSDRLLHGTTALFTFATLGYVEFAANLHASLRIHDPEMARSLVVFCPDRKALDALEERGLFGMAVGENELPEFADFGNDSFSKVVTWKFVLARQLLQQADNVFWCDGDVVATAPISERVHDVLATSGCDIVMQYESPKEVFNTGFWLARGSPGVKRMLADVAAHTALKDSFDDQGYFNETQAHSADLTIAALDVDEFRCGNRFYFSYLFRRPDCRMMHFNYTTGRQTKRSLMVGHRCWHLEEPRLGVLKDRSLHIEKTLSEKIGMTPPSQLLRDLLGRLGIRRRLAALRR